jgi:hypothetical protein
LPDEAAIVRDGGMRENIACDDQINAPNAHDRSLTQASFVQESFA